ncbi:E3 ubiquitin-protein ligase RNF182 [Pristis pectinata]|uniref:E3 ubiquitin-protein ligase RNF182 n=1 Tax=Pristis pectinata TaxID=685728 RepID=UPI00223D23C7|nr:E3 ubiquitin-protein ligase RNF182 [Pristis pectinata]
MSCTDTEGDESTELECKICYQRYNGHSRKPKILDCLHRICARCLNKILDTNDSSHCMSCPFCRQETEIHNADIESLPNDTNIMCKLTARDRATRNSGCKEIVLTPKNLTSSNSTLNSSNCLVINIREVQRNSPRRHTTSDYHADHSLDTMSITSQSRIDQDVFSKICNRVPRILVWLLGFFYFSSLPLGIYLLVIQKVTLGIICVSLVPSSLTVCLVYGFCQCLCQGICDCSSRN